MGKLDLSQYGAVSDLMKNRTAAFQAHEQNLKQEIANHEGHAYGRHGYQSGWEAQFIRCVCMVTPDQKFDPMGLNPHFRMWTGRSGDRMIDEEGEAIDFSIFGAYFPDEGDYAKAPGKISGGFLGPEQQNHALSEGNSVVAGLNGPGYAGLIYEFGTDKLRVVIPFTSVCVGVVGKLFGMGYRRTVASPPAASRDFVLRCIEGFQNRWTWSKVLNGGPSGYPMPGTAKSDAVAFQQMDDLFRFFHVEIFSQKAVRVVYRRSYIPGGAFGPWLRVTMFPDDTISSNGWNPGQPFFSPWLKEAVNKLKQKKIGGVKKYAKLNFDKNAYVWTGYTITQDLKTRAQHVITPWS